MKNRNRFLPLFLYALVLMAIFSWVSGAFGPTGNAIPYSDLRDLFHGDKVGG